VNSVASVPGRRRSPVDGGSRSDGDARGVRLLACCHANGTRGGVVRKATYGLVSGAMGEGRFGSLDHTSDSPVGADRDCVVCAESKGSGRWPRVRRGHRGRVCRRAVRIQDHPHVRASLPVQASSAARSGQVELEPPAGPRERRVEDSLQHDEGGPPRARLQIPTRDPEDDEGNSPSSRCAPWSRRWSRSTC